MQNHKRLLIKVFRQALSPSFYVLLVSNLLHSQGSYSIDFSNREPSNPIRHIAIGFLHTPDSRLPSKHSLEALEPKLFRNHPDRAFSNYERIKQMGGVNEAVLSDAWGYRSFPFATKWEALVSHYVTEAKDKRIDIHWDIWNEPDLSYFWKGSQAEFKETWKNTYSLIRSIDPDAYIVGPSFSRYDFNALKDFILFCKTHNTLPNGLSWHENDYKSAGHLLAHSLEIRKFIDDHNIDIPDLEINEYSPAPLTFNKAALLAQFSLFERSPVSRAARACWEEHSQNGCEPKALNNLLTPSGKPRTIWYAYKYYSEMQGNLIDTPESHDLFALASGENNESYALIAIARSVDLIEISMTNIERFGQLELIHCKNKSQSAAFEIQLLSKRISSDTFRYQIKGAREGDLYYFKFSANSRPRAVR